MKNEAEITHQTTAPSPKIYHAIWSFVVQETCSFHARFQHFPSSKLLIFSAHTFSYTHRHIRAHVHSSFLFVDELSTLRHDLLQRCFIAVCDRHFLLIVFFYFAAAHQQSKMTRAKKTSTDEKLKKQQQTQKLFLSIVRGVTRC